MPAAAIVAERRRLLDVLAGPLAAAHAEIAPDEAAAARLTLRYVTNAPPLPGETATRRARPAAGRDGRQGGLERLDARRAAPRRPGLRARWPRPGQLRLARPAADRDPGPQARRARRRDRARRPPAAAPARRRLLRARPGAALPPRPADRGPAPGVRDDHDARRPRPGAAGDRDRLGGPAGPGGRELSARPSVGRDAASASADERPAPAADGPASATSSRTRRARSASRTSCACRGRSRPSRRSSPSASRPQPAPAG